jgi:exopolysaccharide biosynthesis polyprenyl glycosylphosphotransferase
MYDSTRGFLVGELATTTESARVARRPGGAPLRLRRRRAAASAADWAGLDSDLSPVWEDLAPIPGVPDGVTTSAALARDSALHHALAVADVVAAYLAIFFTLLVIGHAPGTLLPGAVLIAPLVVLASKAIGLYDHDQHTLRKSTIDEIPSILYLSVVFALGVWLGESVFVNGPLGRPQVFSLLVSSFVLISVGRYIARASAQAMMDPERCLVIGNAADADRIADKLDGSPAVNALVIGRVPLRPGERGESSVRTFGYGQSLPRLVLEHDVERVIIAPGSDDPEDILQSIRLLKALGVKVSVLPRLLEVVGSSSSFDEIDGITLLGVRQYGLPRSSSWLKRALDITASGLGLLFISPVLLAIALLIKLDSRGPVFFRQPRIGRKGNRFYILKFRSMVPNAEQIKDELRKLNEVEGGLFKIDADPRITRVGKFLRRTSLDELPQLINVLRGDMSLVGPRPLVPDEDALIQGWQRRRLAVKPGMTGLWQIFGSSRIPMQEMVKIDYLYGANWSIWLDLKILLRTLPYVLSRRGQ